MAKFAATSVALNNFAKVFNVASAAMAARRPKLPWTLWERPLPVAAGHLERGLCSQGLYDSGYQFAIKRLCPRGVVQNVRRFIGEVASMRERRDAAVLAALANYPFELISTKAYPFAEPTANYAMVVKSVFVDLSGQPYFAYAELMRRTD